MYYLSRTNFSSSCDCREGNFDTLRKSHTTFLILFQTGKVLRTFEHRRPVDLIALAHDGQENLVFSVSSGAIRKWNADVREHHVITCLEFRIIKYLSHWTTKYYCVHFAWTENISITVCVCELLFN